ncbi:MAG: ArsR/SmtB family transcription factor [Oscillospiraceae bacterium]|jgi:DNA-binding transcriptional ArsR family regulator
MEERAQRIAELLKVLANENRLLILCALMQTPLTVSEIAKFVPNITQSALSQHLSLLKAHGILVFQKSGQSITYSIGDHRVEAVIHVLKQHYCAEEGAEI